MGGNLAQMFCNFAPDKGIKNHLPVFTMIVDTMSMEQICAEYNKIEKIYRPKCERQLSKGGEKYREIHRYMVKKKPKGHIQFKPLTCKVDASTTFYCVPESLGHNLFKKYGLMKSYFMTFRYKNRMLGLQRTNGSKRLFVIYTSHFMARYIERILESSATREEALLHYINNNSSAYFTNAHNVTDLYDLMGVTDKCVAFASLEGNILIMKTCISPQMLFRNQKRKTDTLEVMLQKQNERNMSVIEAMKQHDLKTVQDFVEGCDNEPRLQMACANSV